MNTRFAMNASKCSHYIAENESWQQMLDMQIKEIPRIREMIRSVAGQEEGRMNRYFTKALSQQEEEMDQLNQELNRQQQHLYGDLGHEDESLYDISTYCNEDILRERIRAVERKYIELKSDCMKYLSAIV